VRVANLVGQVLLDAPRAEGQALAHSLPHGLYLVRYRMGGTWSSVKLILQP
jgi:hypothetical protein